MTKPNIDTAGTPATPPATPPAKPQDPPPDGVNSENSGDGDDARIPKARFDEVIAQRNEARKRLQELEAAEAERKAAEKKAAEEALKEQEKFKELADQREAEIATLTESKKTLETENKELKAALEALLEQELKGVPEWVTPLLENLSLPARLKWLAENKGQWQSKPGGPPKTPDPTGKAGKISDEERRKRAYRTRF